MFYIFIPNKNLIIEVKLNASDYSIKTDVKNYKEYCKSIEIWYLYGIPLKLSGNIKFIGPTKIKHKLTAYLELLEEFVKIRSRICGGKELWQETII